MAGEYFQSERGQISGVEVQAGKEKKDKLKAELESKKTLFQDEVGKAGKVLADADSKLPGGGSKEKISGYKKEITGFLSQVLEKGRLALKKENPDAELESIRTTAKSLEGSIENVKNYVPVFVDVEAARAKLPAAAKKVEAARKAMSEKKLNDNDLATLIGDAGLSLNESEEVLIKWRETDLPADILAVLSSVQQPIDDMQSEIGGYFIDINGKSFETYDEPEKTALIKLRSAKSIFEDQQPKIRDIADAIYLHKNSISDLPYDINDQLSKAIEGLGKAQKELSGIKREDIPITELTAFFDTSILKIQLQLKELADLKANIKTQELYFKGLTPEEKKCVTLDKDGNIVKTPEFAKLPKDKQLELETKFSLVQMSVAMELDEKTADDKEKSMIEGRKKLMKGDIFGAKEDLLAYYNQEASNTGRDQERFSETKEMLKKIAKVELMQMTLRLVAMKQSVKDRYNNNVLGTDMGTDNIAQAEMFIDDMARVIDKAQEMIDKGEAITVNDVALKLRKMPTDESFFREKNGNWVPDTERSETAIAQKKEDLKKDSVAKEILEQKQKFAKEDYESYKRSYERALKGDPGLSGEEITPELLVKMKAKMDASEEKMKAWGDMSVEDCRAYEENRLNDSLRKVKLQWSLKRFQGRFATSNGYVADVFDMFDQQYKLNVSDPEKRRENTLELAKKAREKGLPQLSKMFYEQYFAKALEEGATAVSRKKVSKDFLSDKDNQVKLKETLEKWKQDFIFQNGKPPTAEQEEMASKKMQEIMVGEAYSKAVKLATHEYMSMISTKDSEEWKKAYGGTVALEDFGQEGTFTAMFTDEEWNALPVKIGVMASVSIATAGIADAVVGLGGLGARLVIGEAGMARLTGSLAGRALIIAGNTTLDAATYATSQGALTGLVLQNWTAFSSPGAFLKAMGARIATGGPITVSGPVLSKVVKGLQAAAISGITFSDIKLKDIKKIILGKDGSWPKWKMQIEQKALKGFNTASAWTIRKYQQKKDALAKTDQRYLASVSVDVPHVF